MYINIISGAEITIVDYGTDEDDNYVVLKGGRRLKGDAFMRRYKKKEEEEGDSERKVDFWEVFKVGDEIPLTENQTVRIADEEDDGSGLIATEDVGSGTKRLTDKKMLLDIKEQQDLGFVPGARVRLGSNEGVVREYGLVGEAMIDFGGVVPTSARPRNEADMKAGGYEILSGVESKEMEIREGRFYRHIHSGRTVRVTSSSSHRGTAFEPRAETAGRGILAGMREDDFKEEFEEREFPLGIEMKPGERYLLKDKRRVRLTTVFEALDALQVNYETLSGVDYDEELDIFVDMIEAKIEDPD
ncbi:MAG: hypothetical protein CMI52_03900, partial [Parcubacteria group bacterium]|nr:hypothetical protein [Parcubacteria group bacterium]